MFIYRGKEYERLSDFSSRTQLQFPNAELMKKLMPPGEEITESDKQCKSAFLKKILLVTEFLSRFTN